MGCLSRRLKYLKKTMKVTVGNAGLSNATKNCKLLKKSRINLINSRPLTYEGAAPETSQYSLLTIS